MRPKNKVTKTLKRCLLLIGEKSIGELMIKKFGLLILLLLLINIAVAEVFFQPNFRLGGHIPVSNNRPNPSNRSAGITLDEENKYYFDSLKPTVTYEVDYENQVIKVNMKHGRHELADPMYISFETYLDNVPSAVFEREFEKLRIQNLTQTDRRETKGWFEDIVIKLPPGVMPRAVQRIMGSKAGSLSLTGSQKVTIGVSRTERKTNLATEYGQNTNFDVMMRQDLNLNLKGTIGEKISVTMKYNSNQETTVFDPNNIHIAYTGDEDEIVQSIEAGNTSLSLSGSRYISVSASSQGLFGVKGRFKLGDLDITAIASKEEAEKNTRTYTGSASSESSSIASRNFAKRQQYYLQDPHQIFALYTSADNCPPDWVDNAIKTDQWGQWYVRGEAEPYLPQAPSSGAEFRVYLDDNSASTDRDGVTIKGVSMYDPETGWVNPTAHSQTNSFDELIENVDYYVDYTAGIITFLKRIEQSHTIGVAYRRRSGTQIGYTLPDPSTGFINTRSDTLGVRDPDLQAIVEAGQAPPAGMFFLKPLKMRNQTSASPTWTLERRNIYDLGMRNVAQEGFLLEVYSMMSNTERNIELPVEMVRPGITTYNDFLRLDTDGNGIINGDDATVNLQTGNIILPFIEPFKGLWTEAEYALYNSDSNNSDPNLYFYIEGRIGRDQISLGMMILPGSVSVRVNGRQLTENIDYLVDYDFGQVTFISNEGKDPSASIEIRYENRPMFAVESKTLLGMRADWKPTDNFKLGGTIIYQSEIITDKRPKIGNESRSMVLADIDGEVSAELPFLTTLVDWLPLVKTDTMSKVTLSGEIAMNMPNIVGSDAFGDGTEAWLDDMESVIDSYPMGIMRLTWVPASEPDTLPPAFSFLSGKRVKPNWYNPNTVYNRDVYEGSTLSAEQKNESITVLDIKLLAPPDSTRTSNYFYGGLQKYIGNQIDFSEKEYIEILVKVETLTETPANEVTFFFDMGELSEDFFTDHGGRGVLNTEDGKNGGAINGRLENGEDIGLPKSAGANVNDYFRRDEINGEFPYMNGTEGNGVLDTEDLNDNGRLDPEGKYLRYTATLTDPNSPFIQSDHNGWRFYRIPLKKNDDMEEHGDTYANIIDKISYVRMWYATAADVKVRIVSLEIVGNKWKNMGLREREDDSPAITDKPATEIQPVAENEYMTAGTIDNQKSTRYTAPPKSIEKGTDNQDSFEQSLKVTYNNIQPDRLALVYQRFRESYNFLSYNKLRYYIYVETETTHRDPENLTIVFRVGADSTNYYEIAAPYKLRGASTTDAKMSQAFWQEIEIDYKEITTLKTESPEVQKDDDGNAYYKAGNIEYRMVKKPTLSNIREISMGIYNDTGEPFNGIVYYNEIRVAEPNQDIGFASRLTMDTRFADFSTLRIDYEWKTSDFYTTTARGNANTSLEDKYTITVANNYTLDKFLPLTWGLRLPLNMSYNYSVGKPRYQTNSDVIRSNLSDAEQKRDQNISEAQQADISYAMNRTPSSKILEYTVKNITMGANFRNQKTMTATRADTLDSYRYTAAYNLTIPAESIRLKLFGDYYFFYVPKQYTNSANLRAEFPKRYDWYTPTATDTTWVLMHPDNEPNWRPRNANAQTINTRLLETSNEVRYDIFTDLNSSYKLTTKRDLIDTKLYRNVNIGQEKERNQDIQLQYTPFYTTSFMNTQLTASSNYKETRNTSIVRDTTIVAYNGNVNRSLRASVTLRNSDLLSALANKLGASSNRTFRANTRESSTDFGDFGGDDGGKGDFGRVDLGKDNMGRMDLGKEEPKKDDFFNDDFFTDDFFTDDKGEDEPEKEEPEKEEPGKINEREKTPFGREGREGGRMRGKEGMDDKRGDRGKEELKGDEKDTGDKEQKEKSGSDSGGLNFTIILAETIGLLARVQNFNLGYDNSENSTYINRDNSPYFPYQLGLQQNISDVNNRGYNDSYTASTGFPIIKNLQADTRWAYSIQRSYQPQTDARSKNTNTVWPDIRLSYSGIESLIRMDNLITSSRLQSAYNFSERLSYGGAYWDSPDTEVLTHTFSPLIGWNMNWVKDVTASVAMNLTLAENNSGLNSSTKRSSTSQRTSYTGNAGYSFTGEHGIKLPFIRKRIYFQNQMTTDLSVSYETETRKTIGTEGQESIEYDSDKITVTPRVSYSFHRNVKGGLSGTYDLQTDRMSDVKINIFRLEFWIEVIF